MFIGLILVCPICVMLEQRLKECHAGGAKSEVLTSTVSTQTKNSRAQAIDLEYNPNPAAERQKICSGITHM
jgi:hypothetical protein